MVPSVPPHYPNATSRLKEENFTQAKSLEMFVTHERWLPRIRGIVAVIFFFAVWELLSRCAVVNENILPRPTLVAKTIIVGLSHGQLLEDTFQSIQRVIIGYLIGVLVSSPLGMLCALQKSVGDFAKPIVDFLRPIPPIAWIPIALLWFGFGNPPAYFLVSLGAFFPIFSSVFLGISLVDRGSIEVARCHGASQRLIFWKVIVPQALPSIFSGLKTGLGVAWMVVITAELVGAQSGLGYLIQISRVQLQPENVIAGMVLIGLTGYVLNQGMSGFARVLMPWRQRGRHLVANE